MVEQEFEVAKALQGGGGENCACCAFEQFVGEHGGGGDGAGVECPVYFVALRAAYPFGKRFFVFAGGGGNKLPHGGDLLGAGNEDAKFGADAVYLAAVLVFVAAGGGKGIGKLAHVVGKGLGGDVCVVNKVFQFGRDDAVLPQPNGFVLLLAGG